MDGINYNNITTITLLPLLHYYYYTITHTYNVTIYGILEFSPKASPDLGSRKTKLDRLPAARSE